MCYGNRNATYGGVRLLLEHTNNIAGVCLPLFEQIDVIYLFRTIQYSPIQYTCVTQVAGDSRVKSKTTRMVNTEVMLS